MEQTFESAMQELEQIAAKLDGGKVTLSESIELYEKAAKLCAFCKEKLDAGTGKIAVIRKKIDGLFEEPIEEN